MRGESRLLGTLASLALHGLALVLVLAAPVLLANVVDVDVAQGAGGSGPTGGGGGGWRGLGWGGGARVESGSEHLTYFRVSTAPTPERKSEGAEPQRQPREVVPPRANTPPPSEAATRSDSAVVKDSATSDSTGSASGVVSRGSGGYGDGAGPGRGGGIGSGVGSGRGSGVGPGSGGGDDVVYPPAVISLPVLPLPIPPKVRPYRMVAQFEVDTLGNAKLLGFNPSRDENYNRRIRAMLLEIRFRPAVRADGRPVKAIAIVTAEAM